MIKKAHDLSAASCGHVGIWGLCYAWDSGAVWPRTDANHVWVSGPTETKVCAVCVVPNTIKGNVNAFWCHSCSVHVLAVRLVRIYVYSFWHSWRHKLTSSSLRIWLLQSFCPLFHNVTWDLNVEVINWRCTQQKKNQAWYWESSQLLNATEVSHLGREPATITLLNQHNP